MVVVLIVVVVVDVVVVVVVVVAAAAEHPKLNALFKHLPSSCIVITNIILFDEKNLSNILETYYSHRTLIF